MDFITYMKFIFPICVILAVVIVVKQHVNQYKAIRRKNPGMTAGQAFEQHMDNVNAQAAEDRRERKAIRKERFEKWLAEERAEDARLADDVDYQMIKNGMRRMYEENGKVYYSDGNARYSYDTSARQLKEED